MSRNEKRISLMTACVMILACTVIYAQSPDGPREFLEKGYELCAQGKIEEALTLWQRGLAESERLNDRRMTETFLDNLGNASFIIGRFDDSLHYGQRLLKIRQENGDRNGEGDALQLIGLIYENLGQFEKALHYLERSLVIYREIAGAESEGISLNEIGAIYLALREYDRALQYSEKSLQVRQQSGDRKGEGVSHFNVGLIYENRCDYQKALEHYEKSLKIRREIGDRQGEGASLNSIGNIHETLGRFQVALEYYMQSLTIRKENGDRKGEGTCLNNIGLIYGDLCEYKKALEYHEKSLAIALETGDRQAEGRSLNNAGLIYGNLGYFQKALWCYERSLKIKQEFSDRQGEGTTLNNMGLIYGLIGDFQKALNNFEKSLRLAVETGDRQGEAFYLSNLGNVHDNLGEPRKALQFYEKSLEIRQQIGDLKGEADSLNNMGLIFRSMGEYEKALAYFDRSLKIRQQLGDRQGESISLGNKGTIYHCLGEYEKALEYNGKSLKLAEAVGNLDEVYKAYFNLALTYESMDRADRAIDCFVNSIKALESIRGRLAVEEHKTTFMKDKTDAYEHLIHLLKEKGRTEEAWQFTERAKARTFLDMLGNQKICFRGKADPELVRKEEELDNAITMARAVIEKENNLERIKELALQRDALQKEYEETLEKLKLSNPEYASLKAVEVAALGEIQRALDHDSLILEYFTGRSGSYVFIIGRDSFEMVEIPETQEEIRAMVISLRKQIITKSSVDDDIVSLSGILLPPAVRAKIDGSKRLIVIPHGPLHYLPFSMLKDNKGEYLITSREILTEPSASVWKLCLAKKRVYGDAVAGYALGDRPVSFKKDGEGGARGTIVLSPELVRSGLPPLPATKDEVESIGALFPNAIILMGSDMTSAKVEETIKGKTIIHFATHGILDTLHPLFSGLVLSDRILTTADIFTLDISSNLVVLSACNTACGEMSTGDEIVGMSRAFIYAGSSMVMASLWSVFDESTAALMKYFYQGFRKGKTEAAALREAQLALMERYPQPFYWAPFVLIGDLR